MDLVIVGWHLPGYPGKCRECENQADYVVAEYPDSYEYQSDICRSCITRYNVVADKVAEVFNDLFNDEGKE